MMSAAATDPIGIDRSTTRTSSRQPRDLLLRSDLRLDRQGKPREDRPWHLRHPAAHSLQPHWSRDMTPPQIGRGLRWPRHEVHRLDKARPCPTSPTLRRCPSRGSRPPKPKSAKWNRFMPKVEIKHSDPHCLFGTARQHRRGRGWGSQGQRTSKQAYAGGGLFAECFRIGNLIPHRVPE